MEDMRHQKRESMKLLLLNTKSRLIGESDISKGTVNASIVSSRELFAEALQKNAVYIILLHNLPAVIRVTEPGRYSATQRIPMMQGDDRNRTSIISSPETTIYVSLRKKGLFSDRKNVYGLDLGTYEISI